MGPGVRRDDSRWVVASRIGRVTKLSRTMLSSRNPARSLRDFVHQPVAELADLARHPALRAGDEPVVEFDGPAEPVLDLRDWADRPPYHPCAN